MYARKHLISSGDTSWHTFWAEIISHQLLLKAGYIRRVNSGIYAYMPIMLKLLKNIKNNRNELNGIGCSKLLLHNFTCRFMEKSERWEGYTEENYVNQIDKGKNLV